METWERTGWEASSVVNVGQDRAILKIAANTEGLGRVLAGRVGGSPRRPCTSRCVTC